jgi:hypothetical protein
MPKRTSFAVVVSLGGGSSKGYTVSPTTIKTLTLPICRAKDKLTMLSCVRCYLPLLPSVSNSLARPLPRTSRRHGYDAGRPWIIPSVGCTVYCIIVNGAGIHQPTIWLAQTCNEPISIAPIIINNCWSETRDSPVPESSPPSIVTKSTSTATWNCISLFKYYSTVATFASLVEVINWKRLCPVEVKMARFAVEPVL